MADRHEEDDQEEEEEEVMAPCSRPALGVLGVRAAGAVIKLHSEFTIRHADVFWAGRQVVRKGDDAKAHKELNQLGGNMREEKEMDTGKAQNALSQLTSAAEAEKAAKLERERELSKVKIDRKDVELIMAGPFLSRRQSL